MRSTAEIGDELREGGETETARLYRQAYRAGWNDALDDALRRIRGAVSCSDEWRSISDSVEAMKQP